MCLSWVLCFRSSSWLQSRCGLGLYPPSLHWRSGSFQAQPHDCRQNLVLCELLNWRLQFHADWPEVPLYSLPQGTLFMTGYNTAIFFISEWTSHIKRERNVFAQQQRTVALLAAPSKLAHLLAKAVWIHCKMCGVCYRNNFPGAPTCGL